MSQIDLEKCVTYGKLKGIRETKGSTNSEVYDFTGNSVVSFEWYLYTNQTIPSITFNVDNGTEIYLLNKSFAKDLRVGINSGGISSTVTVPHGIDGNMSHAVYYVDNSVQKIQEWSSVSDFWISKYVRNTVSGSSYTLSKYQVVYAMHSVDYDTNVYVYPGQEVWAYHNSANPRIINICPITSYYESAPSTSQITLNPGARAVCMCTHTGCDWMFHTSG